MSTPSSSAVPEVTERDPLLLLVDSSLGAMSLAVHLTRRSARMTRRVASPLVHGARRLPGVHAGTQALEESLGRRGLPVRTRLARAGTNLADLLVPVIIEQGLRRVDLADVLRRHLDLNVVVAEVDLDAVAARLDVNAVAATLDADAVAARIDLEAILDRVDLTELVMRRLDLGAVATGVLEEIDLVAVAQQVIDALDLPEMIRDSTSSLTTDTVRGARIRSAAADQAVGRVRDRLFHRHDPEYDPHRQPLSPESEHAEAEVFPTPEPS